MSQRYAQVEAPSHNEIYMRFFSNNRFMHCTAAAEDKGAEVLPSERIPADSTDAPVLLLLFSKWQLVKLLIVRRKKMNRGDFLWLAALCAVSSVMLVPSSHQIFISVTKAHPYAMGFVKFAVLATMGELLTIRIAMGEWKKPAGVIYRAIIWGLIGILIVLMFEVFSSGVTAAVSKGLLWSDDGFAGKIWAAFWISTIMNFAFAPAFMTLHRITDTYIDFICGENVPPGDVKLSDVIARIDWQGLVSFVVVKTIPFFWIPAHTVTFLLPPEYRVLMAAYLSIALGAILAYGKRRKSYSSSRQV